MQNSKQGFTLIEILLVVAAIVILAGVVIVAVNPAKQLGEVRNAEREANVNAILAAVQQYTIDNQGILPSSVNDVGSCEDSDNEICATDASSTSSCTDLDVLTDQEEYLVSIPEDPQNESANGTGYGIIKSDNNRVTVCAPDAELEATIEATQ